MKKIEVIRGILKFFILEDQAYAVSDEVIDSEWVRSISVPMPEKLFSRGNKLYFTNDSGLYAYDLVSQEHKLVTSYEALTFAPFEQDKVLVTFKTDAGHRRLGCVANDKLIWNRESSGLYYDLLVNGIVLERDAFRTNKLSCIDAKHGEDLWQYDLTKGHFVKGSLVLQDDCIVISSQERRPAVQDEYAHVGVSASNGNKLWESKSSAFEYTANEEDKLLCSFSANRFGDNELTVLNPSNGLVVTKHFEDYKGSVAGHLNTIDNGRLYFSDNVEGCKLGVIDLSNHSLRSVQLDLQPGVKIFKPIIANQRIYVLDTHETLHIFQIEEDNIIA